MSIYEASEFWDEHDIAESPIRAFGHDKTFCNYLEDFTEKVNLIGRKMMDKSIINVQALWDHEAQVWVASSDDVPGLITEAETTELLFEKLKILIPELLEANGILAKDEYVDIPLNLLSRREELIKARAH